MASTQFFTKTTLNLDMYKYNFIKDIRLGYEYKIFNKDIYNFMVNYISKQTSYINRSDVQNLKENILNIVNSNTINILLNKINLIKESKKTNLLQYSFEIISVIENYNLELKDNLNKLKEKKLKQDIRNALVNNELIEKESNKDEIDNLLWGL